MAGWSKKQIMLNQHFVVSDKFQMAPARLKRSQYKINSINKRYQDRTCNQIHYIISDTSACIS